MASHEELNRRIHKAMAREEGAGGEADKTGGSSQNLPGPEVSTRLPLLLSSDILFLLRPRWNSHFLIVVKK